MELVIDFESRSPIDIKKCGMYIYWQNPYTEVMMLSVKKDLGPTRVWTPPVFRHLCSTEIEDDELEQLTQTADKIIAHNAGFERQGFKYGMTKLGFSDIPLEKVRCTQAQALMCALPRNLDAVARIVSGGKYLKDEDGHKLMLKMSKPRAFVKKECEELLPSLIVEGLLPEDAVWKDVKTLQSKFLENAAVGIIDAKLAEKFIVYRCIEEDFRRLVEYARQDSQVERMVYDKLPKMPESEIEVWRLDQRINDRGVSIDRDNCEGIKKAVNLYVEQLSKHAIEITGGKVTSMKSPSSILSWLREHGIDTDSIDKEAVNFLLTLELPDDVREFLEIRQKTGKSSVAKYDALLNYSVYDGRARGLFTYHVATTGRFGGNGPQLQNLPRPSEKNFVKCGEDDNRKEVHAEIEDAPLLASCDFDFVEMYWKDPMILAADLIRPMMKAESGKQFICADYSAVEGRGLAWVAGQGDKVEAFRKGLDIYKVAASGVYKIPYEQVDGGGKGTQRQIGKTCELALGYGGGWGAMTRFGADKLGLSEEEGKEIVKAWRQANDKIVKFWYALRDASIDAMKFPGDRIKVGKLSFRKRGSFLTMRLPSGRDLFYPNASLEMCDMPWIDDNTGEPAKQKLVTAMTLTAAKQWVRRPLSHVTLTENCVQAFCRDLLCYGLKNLEAEGYPVVMHIHDEAVAEVPKGYGSLGEFENLLAKLPEWAEGLPLRAEGWVGPYYHK